jgi:hypothetical protein
MMKKLYYLNLDILLDVTETFITYSITYKNVDLLVRMDIDSIKFWEGSKELGDLFIVDDNPDFSHKLSGCTYMGFNKENNHCDIKIACWDYSIGRFGELEHIYRDRKINLLL